MKNSYKYLICLFALMMVVFAIGRLTFVWYNQDIEAVAWNQLPDIMLHGALLDMRTTAIALLVPALCVWLMPQRLRWVLVPYFCLLGLVISVTVVADMVMYEFWEFKVCAVHLSYAASPEGTTNSVSTWFLVSRGLTVVVFLLMVCVPAIWLTPSRIEGKRRHWGFILTAIVAMAPINVGHCYHSAPLFHCHAATNSTFRFFDSFRDSQRYMEGEGNVGKAYTTNNELTDTLLRTERPNVLIVQWESLGSNFVKELGGIDNVTPNLSRLIPEGIFWDQYYSSSFRTDRGTVSAYSGIVSLPDVSLMKQVAVHDRLPSLAQSMHKAGYQTGYMYAGAMTNMGKMRYLMDMGFEALMDENYFDKEERKRGWGANDRTAAMKMYKTIAEVDTAARWFMVWQTISSHEPWDVPYHRLDNKILNAFAYTDQCLGELVDSLRTLPAWDNMLVIVIPDHGYLYQQTFDTGDFFHSPMLWLGGAIKEPRRMSVLMNQSDIAATLLAQMGLSHDEYPWSRNVLATDYQPSVYCNYPAGLFYKDETGETLYDLTAEKPVPIGQPVDSIRLAKALSILHHSYNSILNTPTTNPN